MRKSLLLWIALPTVLVSCGSERQSPPLEGQGKRERLTRGATAKDQYTDTRFAYVDSTGNRLIIENSFPKGRVQDMGAMGKKFVLVFYTRIVNETAAPFPVSLAVPTDSFLLANAPVHAVEAPTEAPATLNKPPSLPTTYFKIVLPSKETPPNQASVANYGVTDWQTVLSPQRQPLSTLHRTIKPKATGFVYVVVLASPGAKGPFRAGFRLKDDRWYYRLNQHEIDCGPANAPNLTLRP